MYSKQKVPKLRYSLNPSFSRDEKEIKKDFDPVPSNMRDKQIQYYSFYFNNLILEFDSTFYFSGCVCLTLLHIRHGKLKPNRHSTYPNPNFDIRFTVEFPTFILEQQCEDKINVNTLIKPEEIADMLWFLLMKTDFYDQKRHDITISRAIVTSKTKMQDWHNRKIFYDKTVIETLNEFNFYSDINNLLIKYL